MRCVRRPARGFIVAAAAANAKIAFPGNVRASSSLSASQMSFYQCGREIASSPEGDTGRKERANVAYAWDPQHHTSPFACVSRPPGALLQNVLSSQNRNSNLTSPLQGRAPFRRRRDRQRERETIARSAHVRGQVDPPVSCWIDAGRGGTCCPLHRLFRRMLYLWMSETKYKSTNVTYLLRNAACIALHPSEWRSPLAR